MDYPSNASNTLSQQSSYNSVENIKNNSLFVALENVSITTWIILFFVLAFLGVNIFAYLAKGTQDITGLFTPVINAILSLVGKLTGQVVSVTAGGAKEVVDVTADALDTGLTGLQNLGQSAAQGNLSIPTANLSPSFGGTSVQSTIQPPDALQNNSLNMALNTAKTQQTGGQQLDGQDYEADEASSSIQSGNVTKAGWCFIGEDNGHRACAQVGVNDTCMSGDVFPSQEICINPSLRA